MSKLKKPIAHQNAHQNSAKSGIFCLHPENKKACNRLICRLLVNFDISSSGVSGSPLEHLEVILAIIKEVYDKKKEN
ncbi:hypothetical protein [Pedobacter panaciterrae]